MKFKYFIFLFTTTLAFSSCSGDNVKISYESGIYKPFKQDTVFVKAYTEGRTIDGYSIKPYVFQDNGGDVIYKDMDGGFNPLGEAGTKWNSIILENKNRAYINCPTCLNTPMRVEVINDSLFIKPQKMTNAVKFSPYSEIGFVLVTDLQEVERHVTLRAKIDVSGFIVPSYDIFLRSTSSQKSSTDANYLDIEFLKSELRGSDTLVWVKKETYFRKQ